MIEGVKFKDGIEVIQADQIAALFNGFNTRIDNNSQNREGRAWPGVTRKHADIRYRQAAGRGARDCPVVAIVGVGQCQGIPRPGNPKIQRVTARDARVVQDTWRANHERCCTDIGRSVPQKYENVRGSEEVG